MQQETTAAEAVNTVQKTGSSSSSSLTSRTNLELPYYSKYLLIAAYLASYNPTKMDKRLFAKVSASVQLQCGTCTSTENLMMHFYTLQLCWTLIWLSRHWAWLCQGYWCYRSLIDWLIVLTIISTWFSECRKNEERCCCTFQEEGKGMCMTHGVAAWMSDDKSLLSVNLVLYGDWSPCYTGPLRMNDSRLANSMKLEMVNQ